jgi:subtilisin family serine protease
MLATVSLIAAVSVICAFLMPGRTLPAFENSTVVWEIDKPDKDDIPQKSNISKVKQSNTKKVISGAEVLDEGKNIDGSVKSIVNYTHTQTDISFDQKSKINYVNNIVIVFFKNGTENQRRLEIIGTVGGKCVGYMDAVDQWQVEVEKTNLEGLKSICKKLLRFDEVIYANFDSVKQITTCTIPNDPFGVNTSWNENSPAGYNWGQEAIELPSAWEYNEYCSHITVGLVDDGFDISHAELSGIFQFPSITAQLRNATSSHGTHVSGIIGARANNNVGIAGVLWDTTILGYDFDGALLNFTDTDIYAGLVDCVDSGAKVVNFSIGASSSLDDGESLTQQEIEYEASVASQYMAQMLNFGYDFVVVQAAGNGTHSLISTDAINNGMFCSVTLSNTGQSPEMAQKINDRIIIVGSANNLGNGNYEQSYFSNAGSQVDLCAPGYGIYSCDKNNSYISMAGTSQAAPFVTGVAGMVWSINPSLTGAQVRSIICNPQNQPYIVADSTNVKHPLVNTYGLLNAKCCAQAALDPLPAEYTAVNRALETASQIITSNYTDESVLNLTQAINNVVRGLSVLEQAQVDAMAQAINDAINNLVLKTADYTGVDSALNKAMLIDRLYYTQESLQTLDSAVAAVVRNLTVLQQDIVDEMADNINAALDSLAAKSGILIPEGSTAVADSAHGIIYGLAPEITEQELESRYIKPALNTELVYTYGEYNCLGTGTRVEQVDSVSGEVIAVYYIVIVGDINGDGADNSLDSALLNAISAYLLIPEEESPVFYAADMNGDGYLNVLDAALLNAVAAYLRPADQTAPSGSIQAG